MKKAALVAFFAVLVCASLFCVRTDRKKAYIDFIRNEVADSDANSEELKFALVRLDGDNFPELIYSGGGYTATNIAYYAGGKVHHRFLGNSGFMYYEKENLFYCHYFNHGVELDTVYKLENGEVLELWSGMGDHTKIDITYYAGDKPVTKPQYDEILSEHFNRADASEPVFVTGKNKIAEEIGKIQED